MPRDVPPYCTKETTLAIEDRVKQVADELGVHISYIYALLKGEKKDPFADFKLWFRDIARATEGEGSQHYLDTLESVQRACSPHRRKQTQVNYGTDVLEKQAQIACLKLGGALAVENSAETLRWTRELQRLLQSLERKFMVEDREDSPALKIANG